MIEVKVSLVYIPEHDEWHWSIFPAGEGSWRMTSGKDMEGSLEWVLQDLGRSLLSLDGALQVVSLGVDLPLSSDLWPDGWKTPVLRPENPQPEAESC